MVTATDSSDSRVLTLMRTSSITVLTAVDDLHLNAYERNTWTPATLVWYSVFPWSFNIWTNSNSTRPVLYIFGIFGCSVELKKCALTYGSISSHPILARTLGCRDR